MAAKVLSPKWLFCFDVYYGDAPCVPGTDIWEGCGPETSCTTTSGKRVILAACLRAIDFGVVMTCSVDKGAAEILLGHDGAVLGFRILDTLLRCALVSGLIFVR